MTTETTVPASGDEGNPAPDKVNRRPTFNDHLENHGKGHSKWPVRDYDFDGAHTLWRHLNERGVTIRTVEELNGFMDENPALFRDKTDEDHRRLMGDLTIYSLWSTYGDDEREIRRSRAVIFKG